MSGRLTVRPARPGELHQVGRLILEAYLADGAVDPGGPYAAELTDALRRAREAELLVAVNPEDTLLGTITVGTPDSPLSEVSRHGELEFRMLAVDPEVRLPERDWCPVPRLTLLAFGCSAA